MTRNKETANRLSYLLELVQVETHRLSADQNPDLAAAKQSITEALDSLRRVQMTGPTIYDPQAAFIKCAKCGDYKIQ
jgi:hypothetical protein